MNGNAMVAARLKCHWHTRVLSHVDPELCNPLRFNERDTFSLKLVSPCSRLRIFIGAQIFLKATLVN